ncbi:IS3 family transposase [Clostridium sp.]|uniref:IS3 family transposase n=1 Tax=Clostridium sp. TaxID=1506 RepID=UPI003522435A
MALHNQLQGKRIVGDNDPIEILFSHLKSELIYLVNTTDVDELTNLVYEYIYFYNNERMQSKISMSLIEYLTHAA